MKCTRLLALVLVVAIAGCAQNSALAPSMPAGSSLTPGTPRGESLRLMPNSSSGKIQHVVIIFQENRSTNDLFNGFPGADTTRVGYNSQGQQVQLQPVLLTAPYDLSHSHSAFETEYANGWDLEGSKCKARGKQTCPPKDVRAYGYVPEKEVEPYFTMAKQYAFGDQMFQTNEGPSFPAHQYILSGTSTISDGSSLRASENPRSPAGKDTGGCDSPSGSEVLLIDSYGNENQTAYPCFDRNSLIQLIEAQSLSWRYYQAETGPGLWHGPDAIQPVFESWQFAHDVVAPSSQVLSDISAGKLANVVWVTPTAAASDHAGITDGSGPSWVASVVNAIGQSKYWKNTAIFVTWDDWGGWYDPVSPPQYNSYELGFRVPLIVISPYAKQGYISEVQHEFGSILKFTEEAFNLGSLGTTDVRADDLSDCFNFSKAARKFVPIPAPHDASYFLKRPIDSRSPDDDF
jgi:phospholipase C